MAGPDERSNYVPFKSEVDRAIANEDVRVFEQQKKEQQERAGKAILSPLKDFPSKMMQQRWDRVKMDLFFWKNTEGRKQASFMTAYRKFVEIVKIEPKFLDDPAFVLDLKEMAKRFPQQLAFILPDLKKRKYYKDLVLELDKQKGGLMQVMREVLDSEDYDMYGGDLLSKLEVIGPLHQYARKNKIAVDTKLLSDSVSDILNNDYLHILDEIKEWIEFLVSADAVNVSLALENPPDWAANSSEIPDNLSGFIDDLAHIVEIAKMGGFKVDMDSVNKFANMILANMLYYDEHEGGTDVSDFSRIFGVLDSFVKAGMQFNKTRVRIWVLKKIELQVGYDDPKRLEKEISEASKAFKKYGIIL